MYDYRNRMGNRMDNRNRAYGGKGYGKMYGKGYGKMYGKGYGKMGPKDWGPRSYVIVWWINMLITLCCIFMFRV